MKIIEEFLSIQGEGKFIGVPSYFVRTMGCNLRCIAEGTDILMGDFSTKKIEQISEGDMIMGVEKIKNGDSLVSRYRIIPQLVKKRWISPNQNKTQVTVILENGKEIQCSDEHQFLTHLDNSPKTWNWKEIKNLNEDRESLLHIPDIKILPDSLDYMKGYSVGFIKGDGSIQGNKISVGLVHKGLAEYVHKLFTSIWGNKNKIYQYRTSGPDKNQIYELRYYNKMFTEYYKKINILKQTDEFIRGFLAGFFDAEGTNSIRHNCYVCSVNKKSLDIVEKCFKKLNIKTTRGEWKTDAVSTGNCYVINICGSNLERNMVLIYLNIKCQYKIKYGLLYPNKIKAKVKFATRQKILYDLETELGNFIANGVVVHNCAWKNIDGTITKCDTPYSSWELSQGTIFDVNEFIKNNKGKSFEHVVITGGEPTMQSNLAEVVRKLQKNNYKITIETNGTKFVDGIYNTFISISPKTRSSYAATGHEFDIHLNNNRYMVDSVRKWVNSNNDYQLKFVYNSKGDLGEILRMQKELEIPSNKIYLMPQGITTEQLKAKQQEVVETCINYGFNFAPRLHIDIWGNKRGV